MEHTEQAAQSAYLMIVQRDDDERYELLRQLFQGQRVEVVRDRRVGDRRAAGPRTCTDNRRAGERRAPLPDSWVNLGFFVASRRAPGSQRAAGDAIRYSFGGSAPSSHLTK